jgi:predicted pyridoxine 5'-phosphate oxidase superfamily flavin-nucleotide-binding protein
MGNSSDRTDTGFYHGGSRRLQDQFDTRRVADRLHEVQVHTTFTSEDRALVERARMFFLATANAQGEPECSHKGGLPGFVRVVDDRTLAFPDYNGNGMYRSLGNVLVNPKVGMLFIDFEHPHRLRINGEATLCDTDPLLAEFEGAQLIVRVRATRIFPNCPRYIHKMRLIEHSVYVPRAHYTPPVPVWKQWEEFREVLPRSEPIPPRSLRTYVRMLEQRCSPFRFALRAFRRARMRI